MLRTFQQFGFDIAHRPWPAGTFPDRDCVHYAVRREPGDEVEPGWRKGREYLLDLQSGDWSLFGQPWRSLSEWRLSGDHEKSSTSSAAPPAEANVATGQTEPDRPDLVDSPGEDPTILLTTDEEFPVCDASQLPGHLKESDVICSGADLVNPELDPAEYDADDFPQDWEAFRTQCEQAGIIVSRLRQWVGFADAGWRGGIYRGRCLHVEFKTQLLMVGLATRLTLTGFLERFAGPEIVLKRALLEVPMQYVVAAQGELQPGPKVRPDTRREHELLREKPRPTIQKGLFA